MAKVYDFTLHIKLTCWTTQADYKYGHACGLLRVRMCKLTES